MQEGTITDFLTLVGSNSALQRELAELATKYNFRFVEAPLTDEELSAVSGGLTETTRNARTGVTTFFEDADQKATQYTDLLSSVLKTISTTQDSIISNLK